MKDKPFKIEKEIKLPSVPNFFICSDGFSVPVGQLPEKELRRIGKAWTDALITRAHEQIASAIGNALN